MSCNKIRYKDRAKAIAAKKLRKKDGFDMMQYKCHECQGYHLTSNSAFHSRAITRRINGH